MKKILLSVATLLIITSFCMAQRGLTSQRDMDHSADRARAQASRQELEQHRIIVTYQKNTQGNYDFTCENRAFCNYIVEVNFNDMQNLQADVALPARMTIPPGTRHMFSLRKTTLNQPVHISYRLKWFKGCLNPKVDTNFTYLLPIAPGKETRVYESYYVAKRYGGESEPKGWYVLGIGVHSGDTVYAARSGRVTETLEDADIKDTAISYAKGENFVEICHNDCSFGRYRVFRDSSIFVHPGDWVVAGQPIGIAGGDNYISGPHVQFSVSYNFDEEVLKDGQPTEKVHHWAYVPILFWVKDKGAMHLANHGTYASDHPADLVTKEMSKKEAKKWMEARKG